MYLILLNDILLNILHTYRAYLQVTTYNEINKKWQEQIFNVTTESNNKIISSNIFQGK